MPLSARNRKLKWSIKEENTDEAINLYQFSKRDINGNTRKRNLSSGLNKKGPFLSAKTSPLRNSPKPKSRDNSADKTDYMVKLAGQKSNV